MPVRLAAELPIGGPIGHAVRGVSTATGMRQPDCLLAGFRICCGWLGQSSALWGLGQRNADLYNGAQFRDLCMLEELDTDPKLSTDSHETRSKAEPGHVPRPGGLSRHSNFHRAWM